MRRDSGRVMTESHVCMCVAFAGTGATCERCSGTMRRDLRLPPTIAFTDDMAQDEPVFCVACCRNYDTEGMYGLTQEDCDEYGVECKLCGKQLWH